MQAGPMSLRTAVQRSSNAHYFYISVNCDLPRATAHAKLFTQQLPQGMQAAAQQIPDRKFVVILMSPAWRYGFPVITELLNGRWAGTRRNTFIPDGFHNNLTIRIVTQVFNDDDATNLTQLQKAFEKGDRAREREKTRLLGDARDRSITLYYSKRLLFGEFSTRSPHFNPFADFPQLKNETKSFMTMGKEDDEDAIHELRDLPLPQVRDGKIDVVRDYTATQGREQFTSRQQLQAYNMPLPAADMYPDHYDQKTGPDPSRMVGKSWRTPGDTRVFGPPSYPPVPMRRY